MLSLDAFQLEAISFFDSADGRVIYADDMGARKTATTLYWLDRTYDSGKKILIVVPKAVHVDHWLEEAKTWAPNFWRFYGRGSKDQRATKQVDWGSEGGLYVTTYDSMKKDDLRLLACKPDAVVFDEGHNLKGRTTVVAKSANKFASKSRACLIVTGTPVLNKADELWQYLHMLFPKQYTSYWNWAREHFHVTLEYHGGHQHEVVGGFKDGHEDIVRAQLSGIMIQREIADLFPGEAWVEEPIYGSYPIELSPREKKLYKQLVEHSWGVTPSGVITASSRLVVSGRLEQLASDWGTFAPEAEIGSKVKAAAQDIVEWTRDGVGVVAFTTYRETANRIAQVAQYSGLSAVTYHGGMSDDEKAEALKEFRSGKANLIVGTYKSMREGVDGLQYATNKVALIDLDWVPALVDQAIGRVKRSGQTKLVEVRYYYAVGTVEQTKYKANLAKVNITRGLKGLDLKDVLYGGIDLSDDELELVFADD